MFGPETHVEPPVSKDSRSPESNTKTGPPGRKGRIKRKERVTGVGSERISWIRKQTVTRDPTRIGRTGTGTVEEKKGISGGGDPKVHPYFDLRQLAYLGREQTHRSHWLHHLSAKDHVKLLTLL